jgi:hypothetical protein
MMGQTKRASDETAQCFECRWRNSIGHNNTLSGFVECESEEYKGVRVSNDRGVIAALSWKCILEIL